MIEGATSPFHIQRKRKKIEIESKVDVRNQRKVPKHILLKGPVPHAPEAAASWL